MNGGNSTPTKMLENSIKLNIHTYLVQECGVECRRMEELAFLHEVVCLHLPLALQVDEGGVGLVNGVAVWLLLLSSMCRLLVPCRGWWIFPALAAAPSKPENSIHGGRASTSVWCFCLEREVCKRFLTEFSCTKLVE